LEETWIVRSSQFPAAGHQSQENIILATWQLGISFAIYYLIFGLLVDWEAVSAALKASYRRCAVAALTSAHGTFIRNLVMARTRHAWIAIPNPRTLALMSTRHCKHSH
jgi:hypothetical protein